MNKNTKKHKIFGRIYSIILIVISFVIFKSNNMQEVTSTISGMFGINGIDIINSQTIYQLRNYIGIVVIAIIAATPIFKKFTNIKINKEIDQEIDQEINKEINKETEKKDKIKEITISIIEIIFYTGLFIAVTSFLIDQSFNPFLYFRF